MQIRWFVSVVVCLLVVSPSVLFAQGSDDEKRRSHFGVIVDFGLPSDLHDRFKQLLDVATIDIRSRDFEIGIIRGSEWGGDWGVSYIQKRYDDGSIIDDVSENCFGGSCFRFGNRDSFQDVQLRGVSVHKFMPFVTIKGRAQVGITFGGGVGKLRGRAQRQQFDVAFIPPNTTVQTEQVTQVGITEVFLEGLDTIPIWKIEVTGAVIVAPGFKVRVGGGLNFMNYPAASVSLTYLFGS